MTKEKLKEIGLTDEQAEKVLGLAKTSFADKGKLETVTTELNQAKEQLKQRDEQLETLKTANGTAEKLKSQISELQTANQQMEQKHAAELKRVKREALDERLLLEAKAINQTAVKPFLTPIDDSVDDEGYMALRKQHIEALTKGESTGFLFKSAGDTPLVTGTSPGESGNHQLQSGGTNPFDSKTYDEAAQIKLYKTNPELARTLARQAGFTYI